MLCALRPPVVLPFLVMLLLGAAPLRATTIILKNGQILDGNLAQVASLMENLIGAAAVDGGPQPQIRKIYFIDDGLRRTFFSRPQVADHRPTDNSAVHEKIRISQPVAQNGSPVGRVGAIISITPFDDNGRRIFSMAGPKGPINVVQGITEITPRYSKVEALQAKQPFQWEMRMATSSIPRETLHKILDKKIDRTKLDHRLKVVRLFLQSERYKDAQDELTAVIKDFPTEKRLDSEVKALRQLHARRIVDEIKLRQKAGQHRFAHNHLQQFPPKDVAGETLAEVRQLIADYDEAQAQGKETLEKLAAQFDAIKSSPLRDRCKKIRQEIADELNINTIDRMADFNRLVDDEQLSAEEKVSLAISGWLLGSGAAGTNLAVSLSLVNVREKIREYINEPGKLKRSGILGELGSQEGASVAQAAKIIAHMKPPVETLEQEKPGFFQLSVSGGPQEQDVNYYVQLPPEYDPYRKYPTIVTLHGGGSNSALQLDWWSGAVDAEGNRQGQGSRHGYIVVAVDWTKTEQHQYDYSAREHAAVLGCLRDASRRFAVDADRVFLSGHSMGGDAAWDIALAHPDLWAGVIPIVAQSDRYCALYSDNAEQLSWYFVGGELDGNKATKNARDLDRYLNNGKCDVMVVEFMGRGHENFFDEIQNLFDWMGRHQRNFHPKQFEVVSARPWDNFFWWIEVQQFPQRTLIEPASWPPKRGFRPAKIKGASLANNSLSIMTGMDKLTLLLSPEVIDFNQPIRVRINGKPVNNLEAIEPSLEVLLEDVRTRADRAHPFWAKIER